MQGADEFAAMFEMGQHGKLYLVPGCHARGRTFHIWVLPSDQKITTTPWSVKDAVEVYGIVGGQPGWTESYGWLHHGPWQDDFAALVKQRKADIEAYRVTREAEKAREAQAEAERTKQLLAAY